VARLALHLLAAAAHLLQRTCEGGLGLAERLVNKANANGLVRERRRRRLQVRRRAVRRVRAALQAEDARIIERAGGTLRSTQLVALVMASTVS